jgi:Putative GTPase activating protein for Arf
MAIADNRRTTVANSKEKPCAASAMMRQVSKELESIRCVPIHEGVSSFPVACRAMMYSLPGNTHCADCGAPSPEWASVSYGILLCLRCSGRHRSFGVSVSRVRSIEMDAWSHGQVIAMLEGGNDQLTAFYDRHGMGARDSNDMMDRRYDTKAALFYRSNLKNHVDTVASAGEYKGREAARRWKAQVYSAQQSSKETLIGQ